MTQEEAYAAGFCKAAEAAGVDPVALYKHAQAVKVYSRLGALLSRARAGAKGAGGRYLELLRGGNADALQAYTAGIPANAGRGGKLRAWLNAITGKGVRGAKADLARVNELGSNPGTFEVYDMLAPAANARFGAHRLAASELRKVLAARLGTGIAGVGGIGAGAYALRGGKGKGNGDAQQGDAQQGNAQQGNAKPTNA